MPLREKVVVNMVEKKNGQRVQQEVIEIMSTDEDSDKSIDEAGNGNQRAASVSTNTTTTTNSRGPSQLYYAGDKNEPPPPPPPSLSSAQPLSGISTDLDGGMTSSVALPVARASSEAVATTASPKKIQKSSASNSKSKRSPPTKPLRSIASFFTPATSTKRKRNHSTLYPSSSSYSRKKNSTSFATGRKSGVAESQPTISTSTTTAATKSHIQTTAAAIAAAEASQYPSSPNVTSEPPSTSRALHFGTPPSKETLFYGTPPDTLSSSVQNDNHSNNYQNMGRSSSNNFKSTKSCISAASSDQLNSLKPSSSISQEDIKSIVMICPDKNNNNYNKSVHTQLEQEGYNPLLTLKQTINGVLIKKLLPEIVRPERNKNIIPVNKRKRRGGGSKNLKKNTANANDEGKQLKKKTHSSNATDTSQKQGCNYGTPPNSPPLPSTSSKGSDQSANFGTPLETPPVASPFNAIHSNNHNTPSTSSFPPPLSTSNIPSSKERSDDTEFNSKSKLSTQMAKDSKNDIQREVLMAPPSVDECEDDAFIIHDNTSVVVIDVDMEQEDEKDEKKVEDGKVETEEVVSGGASLPTNSAPESTPNESTAVPKGSTLATANSSESTSVSTHEVVLPTTSSILESSSEPVSAPAPTNSTSPTPNSSTSTSSSKPSDPSISDKSKAVPTTLSMPESSAVSKSVTSATTNSSETTTSSTNKRSSDPSTLSEPTTGSSVQEKPEKSLESIEKQSKAPSRNTEAVNVLQPRKKKARKSIEADTIESESKGQSEEELAAVTVLQPRKKTKKSTTDTTDTTKSLPTEGSSTNNSGIVNFLQPRKKAAQEKSQVNGGSNKDRDNSQHITTTNEEALDVESNSRTEVVQRKDMASSNQKNEISPPLAKDSGSKEDTLSNSSTTAKDDNFHLTQKENSSNQVVNKESDDSPQEVEDIQQSRFKSMVSTYEQKLNDVLQTALDGSLDEETFQEEARTQKTATTEYTSEATVGDATTVVFKDEWIPELALLVQGSPLSLEALSCKAHAHITNLKEDEDGTISLDAVVSKIKLIASRSQYLQDTSITTKQKSAMDVYNDTSDNLMWRWELTSLDLLPNEYKTEVRKARATRKKIKNQQKCVLKLLATLKDSISSWGSSSGEKQNVLIAKISTEEEKVLKFDREAEKTRLLKEAKLLKEKEKAQKQREKEEEKQRINEEKEKAKALKKKETAQKKQSSKGRKIEEVTKKQKAMMSSFFTKPKSLSTSLNGSSSRKDSAIRSTAVPSLTKTSTDQDSEQFWSMLGTNSDACEPYIPFKKLSSSAKFSRKRKTRMVKVNVFVTTASDNPFESQQPYDEERTISIRNRYKFLSFYEDTRPAYCGTWSKKSFNISGRNPIAKDTSHLDYDYDSEAEWEEGDDEQGEDCSEDGNDDDDIDDEEGDTRKYNYNDGWMAEDNHLELENDEDDDDDAKAVRRKKLEAQRSGMAKHDRDYFTIAPLRGGLPRIDHIDSTSKAIPGLTKGINAKGTKGIILLHSTRILSPSLELCLDPFPPTVKKQKATEQKTPNRQSSHDLSDEKMKIFAKFVHNSKHGSKDKLIEELRSEHGDLTSSRAQATRKLDAIATKRRLKSGGGVIWEVKKDVLESLGLEELILKEKNALECVIGSKLKQPPSTDDGIHTVTTTKPVVVSPSRNGDDKLHRRVTTPKKQKAPVSQASVNMLASFLKRKSGSPKEH